jgi:hypothetical protein
LDGDGLRDGDDVQGDRRRRGILAIVNLVAG